MNRLANFSTEPHDPFLVSVLSGKGGVGKSVIAFNLADRLASLGARVLLVDADLATGNIHILAAVQSEYGIREFADGRLSLAEAVRPVAPNLDILTSTVVDPGESSWTVAGAVETARQLRRQATGYDLVVLDHGSGISDPATVLASASDLNFLVLVPELTSIADCYGLFKYLSKSNQAVNCSLLLNRVRTPDEAEYVRTKFQAVAERFLGGVPGFAGYLSEDETVRKSIAGQKPVAAVAPDSAVVGELGSIARRLADKHLRSRSTGHHQKINIHAAAADTRG